MSSAADSSATRISLDPIEAQQIANATIDVKELLVASRDSMLFADPEDRDDPRPEAADFPTHGVAAVRSGPLTLRRIWDELELERQAFVLNQDEDVIVADTGALVDGSEQVFGAWGADDRRSGTIRTRAADGVVLAGHGVDSAPLAPDQLADIQRDVQAATAREARLATRREARRTAGPVVSAPTPVASVPTPRTRAVRRLGGR